MSFDKSKPYIEEGDLAVLYLGVNSLHAIEVKSKARNRKDVLVDNVFQTTYGALHVKNLIGIKYGSRVQLSKGWGYVLHPTPELWTLTLPHRTQIIYTPDISMIIFQLELRPGSVVVESGTGSGSLSHALIRAVKPSGLLYTFDFHEHRASLARAEFEAHDIGKYVIVKHCDVCQSGFGPDVSGKADAVFLDLPHPWDAVPHAVVAMKSAGGRICSFSPCVEQVQRTCEALRKARFTELITMEILLKEYHVLQRNLQVLDLEKLEEENPTASVFKDPYRCVTAALPATLPGHTGYLTFATLPPVWARTPTSTDTTISINVDAQCDNGNSVFSQIN